MRKKLEATVWDGEALLSPDGKYSRNLTVVHWGVDSGEVYH